MQKRKVIVVVHSIVGVLDYFDPCSWAKYCSQCVCVCLQSHISETASTFHHIFCTHYLRPWLDPALTTLQYVMYFRFCG